MRPCGFLLAGTKDTINADTISQAFDRSGRELKELGKFVPATVDRAGKRLKHEVAAAGEKMSPKWNAFSERSHGLFEIWKDKGGQFVNQAHTALNSWVSRYRDKNGKEKNEDGVNENDVKSWWVRNELIKNYVSS